MHDGTLYIRAAELDRVDADAPDVGAGFYLGVLVALPPALLFWGVIFLVGRAVVRCVGGML